MTTMTIDREAPMMTGTNPAQAIKTEIDALRGILAAGVAGDQTALLDALDRITQLHLAGEAIRDFVAEHGQTLVTQALQADVDQADLIGRPYGETVVRRLARAAGLPPRRPGPRRRRIGRQLPPQT